MELFGISVRIAVSLMLALDSFCAITSCMTSSRDENSCLTCALGTVLQHLALLTRNPRVLLLSGHLPRVASRIEPMSGNPYHIFHWMLETVGVTVDILYTLHSPVKGWSSYLFTNHHRFWSNKHLSDILVILNSNDVSPQTTLRCRSYLPCHSWQLRCDDSIGPTDLHRLKKMTYIGLHWFIMIL